MPYASEGRPASLVLRRPDAGWSLTLYPTAAEGGGSFTSSIRPSGGGVRGAAADPVRAAAEASRRAGSKVRRYCAANGLDRLGTLTYAGAGCHDPRQARADVGDFFRRLRGDLGARPFPYLWVPEWHPGGHGLHLHYAMGRFVQRSHVQEAWGRGFVHVKRLTDLPSQATGLESGRAAARYLSKYVTKTFDAGPDVRPVGLHRYEVAEGYQPKAVRLRGRSADEVIDLASSLMLDAPAVVWSSAGKEGWEGPPALWLSWNRVAS